MAPHDDPAGLRAWLALVLSEGMGNRQGRRLLRAFGLPGQVLCAPRAALRRILPAELVATIGRGELLAARVDAACQWAEAPGHRILCLGDADYPPALLDIPDPPLLLYAMGQVALLQRPSLAVVGSRKATRQGVDHAEQFAAHLSGAGLTIVSGLALGIDAAAHVGGLRGVGASVAVVGTGIDICYPRQHQALTRQLAEQGCVLSEYPLGMPPLAANFPRRNRLISGLARGVLVVEAELRSGSLVTARLAADQGRDVFAIPGSIQSPLAKGCHQLIGEGARLVQSPLDILDEWGMAAVPQRGRAASSCQLDHEPDMSRESRLVIQAMGFDPVDADTLAQRAGLDAAALAAVLLGLELDGVVEVLPGPRYRRLRASN